ncbi:MAG: glycosyltransferase family 4 protein [Candidatus Lambdaproteobacteria bacterium]|nr:glycosyltransferase family 4 protein [Candidatus Lambdaproteobacteria bacterium]
MKVILNIDSLKPPITGIGNYTLHLSEALPSRAEVASLQFFSRMHSVPTRNRSAIRTLIPARVRHAVRRLPYAYEARDKLAEVVLRQSTAGQDFLYHEPNYIAVRFAGPSVVTVSDLSHLRYPHFHPRVNVKRLEKHLGRSVAEAAQVITHSEFIRQELVGMMGVPPERISIVSLGVSEEFRPRSEAELTPVLEPHGLAGVPYLLSVCTLEPRKNLSGLIQAFASLPKSVRRTHPLVLVGHKGWLTESIESRMRPLQDQGELLWLGYVPSATLPMLYAGAYGFTYPSFYEGFGLPPLEAMACGVPVLTSNVSAMPEVVGRAAAMIDPLDVDDIARGLQRLLYDHDFRQTAKQAGFELAREYTWKRCVDQTIAAYRAALSVAYGAESAVAQHPFA